MTPSYRESLDWLLGLQWLGIKFGLGNMRTLMRLLGHPERAFKSVHIAGTNGKGSTAAFLVEIAQKAGLRCGWTTSPHLFELTERIRIGEEEIPRQKLARLVQTLRSAILRHNARGPSRPLRPTFFEAVIALALLYFAERNVDLAVVETGLGGRLDATNVITPIVTVITTIGIEHSEFLGNTVRSIAGEKAGIIKPGVPVVSGVEQPEAVEIIRRTAASREARLHLYDRDFSARSTGKTFTYTDGEGRLRRLRIGLAGTHQVLNAALAIRTARELERHGFTIPDAAIRRGLATAKWPGRLERFDSQPPWLLDCAHNPDAVRTLADHLANHYPDHRILAVFGAMEDKDYAAMMEVLVPCVADWIFTRPAMARAESPDRLLAACPSAGKMARRRRVRDALALAAERERRYDLVLVTGSIFLIGEVYRFVEKHTLPRKQIFR